MGAASKVVGTGLKALDLATTVLPGKSKGTEKSSTLDKGGFGDLANAPKAAGSGEPSMRRGLSMDALDLAKSKLNPQHLVAAGSDMASKFNKFTNPINSMAANTPSVPLTSDQQGTVDSAKISAAQNQKVEMQLAEINMQSQRTKAIAQQMVDGLKDALSVLNSK